mgnify:CR=1 FL=1
MNKGLEILMARIDSNPEGFASTGFSASRWQTLIASYEKMLPEEDMKAFKAKLHERACNKFTEAVMEELLDPKLENNPFLVSPKGMRSGGVTLGQSSGAIYNGATATLSASGNLTTNSLTLGQTQIQEQEMQ